MRDCKDVEDIMGERLAEIVAHRDNGLYPSKQLYDKIPQQFTTVDAWVTHTNLLCCECGCPYTWPPVFIPEAIEYSGIKRGEYKPIKPIGLFCTFICANMFIMENYPKSEQWEKVELLKLLHTILTGGCITDIPIGTHRTDMVQHGGTMSISEFQSKNKLLSTQYNITFPPEMFALTTVADCVDSEQPTPLPA